MVLVLLMAELISHSKHVYGLLLKFNSQSGKRRAEYFPIRHFGFLGARMLAVNARRRVERLFFQKTSHGRLQPFRDSGNCGRRSYTSRRLPNDAADKDGGFDGRLTDETSNHDLWSKYVIETIHREKHLFNREFVEGDCGNDGSDDSADGHETYEELLRKLSGKVIIFSFLMHMHIRQKIYVSSTFI